MTDGSNMRRNSLKPVNTVIKLLQRQYCLNSIFGSNKTKLLLRTHFGLASLSNFSRFPFITIDMMPISNNCKNKTPSPPSITDKLCRSFSEDKTRTDNVCDGQDLKTRHKSFTSDPNTKSLNSDTPSKNIPLCDKSLSVITRNAVFATSAMQLHIGTTPPFDETLLEDREMQCPECEKM